MDVCMYVFECKCNDQLKSNESGAEISCSEFKLLLSLSISGIQPKSIKSNFKNRIVATKRTIYVCIPYRKYIRKIVEAPIIWLMNS